MKAFCLQQWSTHLVVSFKTNDSDFLNPWNKICLLQIEFKRLNWNCDFGEELTSRFGDLMHVTVRNSVTGEVCLSGGSTKSTHKFVPCFMAQNKTLRTNIPKNKTVDSNEIITLLWWVPVKIGCGIRKREFFCWALGSNDWQVDCTRC